MNFYYQFSRRFRKFFTIDEHSFRTLSDFNRAADEIAALVRFFYIFLTFFAYQSSRFLVKIGEMIPSDPLWPIALLGKTAFVGYGTHVVVIGLFTCLAAVAVPQFRIVRILVFLFLFLQSAFLNSFGSIAHSQHFIIFVSFLFIFLPKNHNAAFCRTRSQTLSTISVFWIIQSLLLLSYSLAGTLKVLSTGLDIFSLDGLVRVILNRAIPNGGSPIILEKLVVEYPTFIQMFYWGNLYLQLISLFVLFRPSLHRTYGLVLIAFHFGTFLLLQIQFTPHIIVWGLFFVMSPFSPRSLNVFEQLRSLPLIGYVFRKKKELVLDTKVNSTAYLVYDGDCPFCSKYTELLNIKDKIGALQLINARDGGELVRHIEQIPFDINEGMVFVYGDNYYFGSDALHVLSLLSSSDSVFGKLNKLAFSSPLMAKFGYPILRFGRNMSLKVLGIKRLPTG
jgi:predicted DCC family thiol-disulfide oxidoreductase YuxK